MEIEKEALDRFVGEFAVEEPKDLSQERLLDDADDDILYIHEYRRFSVSCNILQLNCYINLYDITVFHSVMLCTSLHLYKRFNRTNPSAQTIQQNQPICTNHSTEPTHLHKPFNTTNHPQRMTVLNFRLIRVAFMVNEVASEQIFLKVIQFSLSVSCCLFINSTTTGAIYT